MFCQCWEGHLKDVLMPAGVVILHTEGGASLHMSVEKSGAVSTCRLSRTWSSSRLMTSCSCPAADAAAAAKVYSLTLIYELKTWRMNQSCVEVRHQLQRQVLTRGRNSQICLLILIWVYRFVLNKKVFRWAGAVRETVTQIKSVCVCVCLLAQWATCTHVLYLCENFHGHDVFPSYIA